MIEISGDIKAELNGQQMVLTGEGTDLKLEVEQPDHVLKSLNPGRSQRAQAVRKLAQELQRRGLTVRVVSQGKKVAVLGISARPGLLGWLLHTPHLELGINWKVIKLLVR